MKKWIAFIALILTTSVCYGADDSIVVNGGWLHTSSSAYGESGTGSVRYEHRLYKNLWVAPEYTYHGGMSHNNGQDVSYGDVSGHSLLADLIWYPKVAWATQPYILVGAGWSWWYFDKDNTNVIDVDLGDSFAYKVGVGASYPINSSWSLVTEWSFFKTDIPKDAYNPDGSESVLLGDDHGKIGEEEFCITVGARYSW